MFYLKHIFSCIITKPETLNTKVQWLKWTWYFLFPWSLTEANKRKFRNENEANDSAYYKRENVKKWYLLMSLSSISSFFEVWFNLRNSYKAHTSGTTLLLAIWKHSTERDRKYVSFVFSLCHEAQSTPKDSKHLAKTHYAHLSTGVSPLLITYIRRKF